MKAKLVSDDGRQRFYKLSEPIFKTQNKIFTVKEILENCRKNLKSEFKYLLPETQQSCDLICISEAHTHTERLVFLGFRRSSTEYSRTLEHIDGKITGLMTGGDPDAVYEDKVYLRRIAMANKLTFEGIEND